MDLIRNIIRFIRGLFRSTKQISVEQNDSMSGSENGNLKTSTSRKVLQEISPVQNVFVNNDNVLDKKQTPPETDTTTVTEFHTPENSFVTTTPIFQKNDRRRSRFRTCSTDEDNLSDLPLNDSPVCGSENTNNTLVVNQMDHLIKLFKKFGVNSPSNKGGQKSELDQSSKSEEKQEKSNISESIFYDAIDSKPDLSQPSTIESVSVNEKNFRDSLECLGVSKIENIDVNQTTEQDSLSELPTFSKECSFPVDDTSLQQKTLPSFDEIFRNVISESSRIQNSHDENYVSSNLTFAFENESTNLLDKTILTATSVLENDTGIYVNNTTKELETKADAHSKNSESVNENPKTNDLPTLDKEIVQININSTEIEANPTENLTINCSIVEENSILDEFDTQDFEEFIKNEQQTLGEEDMELELGDNQREPNDFNTTETMEKLPDLDNNRQKQNEQLSLGEEDMDLELPDNQYEANDSDVPKIVEKLPGLDNNCQKQNEQQCLGEQDMELELFDHQREANNFDINRTVEELPNAQNNFEQKNCSLTSNICPPAADRVNQNTQKNVSLESENKNQQIDTIIPDNQSVENTSLVKDIEQKQLLELNKNSLVQNEAGIETVPLVVEEIQQSSLEKQTDNFEINSEKSGSTDSKTENDVILSKTVAISISKEIEVDLKVLEYHQLKLNVIKDEVQISEVTPPIETVTEISNDEQSLLQNITKASEVQILPNTPQSVSENFNTTLNSTPIQSSRSSRFSSDLSFLDESLKRLKLKSRSQIDSPALDSNDEFINECFSSDLVITKNVHLAENTDSSLEQVDHEIFHTPSKKDVPKITTITEGNEEIAESGISKVKTSKGLTDQNSGEEPMAVIESIFTDIIDTLRKVPKNKEENSVTIVKEIQETMEQVRNETETKPANDLKDIIDSKVILNESPVIKTNILISNNSQNFSNDMSQLITSDKDKKNEILHVTAKEMEIRGNTEVINLKNSLTESVITVENADNKISDMIPRKLKIQDNKNDILEVAAKEMEIQDNTEIINLENSLKESVITVENADNKISDMISHELKIQDNKNEILEVTAKEMEIQDNTEIINLENSLKESVITIENVDNKILDMIPRELKIQDNKNEILEVTAKKMEIQDNTEIINLENSLKESVIIVKNTDNKISVMIPRELKIQDNKNDILEVAAKEMEIQDNTEIINLENSLKESVITVENADNKISDMISHELKIQDNKNEILEVTAKEMEIQDNTEIINLENSLKESVITIENVDNKILDMIPRELKIQDNKNEVLEVTAKEMEIQDNTEIINLENSLKESVIIVKNTDNKISVMIPRELKIQDNKNEILELAAKGMEIQDNTEIIKLENNLKESVITVENADNKISDMIPRKLKIQDNKNEILEITAKEMEIQDNTEVTSLGISPKESIITVEDTDNKISVMIPDKLKTQDNLDFINNLSIMNENECKKLLVKTENTVLSDFEDRSHDLIIIIEEKHKTSAVIPNEIEIERFETKNGTDGLLIKDTTIKSEELMATTEDTVNKENQTTESKISDDAENEKRESVNNLSTSINSNFTFEELLKKEPQNINNVENMPNNLITTAENNKNETSSVVSKEIEVQNDQIEIVNNLNTTVTLDMNISTKKISEELITVDRVEKEGDLNQTITLGSNTSKESASLENIEEICTAEMDSSNLNIVTSNKLASENLKTDVSLMSKEIYEEATETIEMETVQNQKTGVEFPNNLNSTITLSSDASFDNIVKEIIATTVEKCRNNSLEIHKIGQELANDLNTTITVSPEKSPVENIKYDETTQEITDALNSTVVLSHNNTSTENIPEVEGVKTGVTETKEVTDTLNNTLISNPNTSDGNIPEKQQLKQETHEDGGNTVEGVLLKQTYETEHTINLDSNNVPNEIIQNKSNLRVPPSHLTNTNILEFKEGNAKDIKENIEIVDGTETLMIEDKQAPNLVKEDHASENTSNKEPLSISDISDNEVKTKLPKNGRPPANLQMEQNIDEAEEHFVSGEKFSWRRESFGDQSRTTETCKGPRPSVLNLFDPLLSKKSDSPKAGTLSSFIQLCKSGEENKQEIEFKKPPTPKTSQWTKPETSSGQRVKSTSVQNKYQNVNNERLNELLVDIPQENIEALASSESKQQTKEEIEFKKPSTSKTSQWTKPETNTANRVQSTSIQNKPKNLNNEVLVDIPQALKPSDHGKQIIEQIKKTSSKEEKLQLLDNLEDIVYAACIGRYGKENLEKVLDERSIVKEAKLEQLVERYNNLVEENKILANEQTIVRQHLEKCCEALDDVKVKYDSRKEMILQCQDRETQMLNIIDKQFEESNTLDKKYQTLKAQASQQLEKLSAEYNEIKHSCDCEVLALQTQLRRLQLQNESLEQDIKQKTDERNLLNDMCDNLLKKKK